MRQDRHPLQWIALPTGFFDSPRIRLLLGRPGGREAVLLLLRLQCFAGTCNCDGEMRDARTGQAFDEEALAACFNERPSVVRKAVNTLAEVGILDRSEDGALHITDWSSTQMLTGIERYNRNKAAARERQRRRRQESAGLAGLPPSATDGGASATAGDGGEAEDADEVRPLWEQTL